MTDEPICPLCLGPVRDEEPLSLRTVNGQLAHARCTENAAIVTVMRFKPDPRLSCMQKGCPNLASVLIRFPEDPDHALLLCEQELKKHGHKVNPIEDLDWQGPREDWTGGMVREGGQHD